MKRLQLISSDPNYTLLTTICKELTQSKIEHLDVVMFVLTKFLRVVKTSLIYFLLPNSELN